jgi:hypothetical protein
LPLFLENLVQVVLHLLASEIQLPFVLLEVEGLEASLRAQTAIAALYKISVPYSMILQPMLEIKAQ